MSFLIGLVPFIQEPVLRSSSCSIEEFISEAKKHFIIPKIELLEPHVKIEPESWGDYDANDNDVDLDADEDR